MEQFPEGYGSRIADGRLYGEALLDPTFLYSSVTEAVFDVGIPVHYLANITGHGWRKLMRHPSSFLYRVTMLPPVPTVLQFIVEKAGLELSEAYGTLNMGAGFVLFVPEAHAAQTIAIAKRHGLKAYHAGRVEEGEKQVVIEPLDIIYAGESLNLRG